MIRIRPGRTWRLNPAALAELGDGGARAFDPGSILDVLGIEVDGVDIASGLGEGQVLLAVDELCRALLRIGEGEPAAQATIGPGPAELVLEARGEDLLLTLCSLAPPGKIVAAGLLVDAQRMRAAAVRAVRGLLLDLIAVSPQLSDAPLARSLGLACTQLSQGRQRPQRRALVPVATARTRAFKLPRIPEQLALRIDAATVARLLSIKDAPHAPLAAHLGPVSISLSRSGGPGLSAEGPGLLLMRELLAGAARLVEAVESAASEASAPFGPHELRWSGEGLCELRAAGLRTPSRLLPLQYAQLVCRAARAYAEVPLRAAPDELAGDLRETARKLERHLRDLLSGDLRRKGSLAPPPRPAQEEAPPAPRMRRLLYRAGWEAEALRVLPLLAGPVVLELPGQVVARDAESGEETFRAETAGAVAARDEDVFYIDSEGAVVRASAATGELRWKRRLRGAGTGGALWPLPRGVARALPGEGVALIGEAGALRYRTKLDSPPRLLVETPRGIACALLEFCVGLDADGGLAWKRRARVRELLACGSLLLALEARALACLDAETGKPLWAAPVPAGAHALTIFGESVALIAGAEARSFALHDGMPRPPLALFAGARQLLAAHEPDALVACGAGGAQRLDGPRWSLAPDAAPGADAAQSAEAGRAAAHGEGQAQLQRGVLLVPRAQGTELFELASGLRLATLAKGEALLRNDLGCLVLRDGRVQSHACVTWLSVL